MKKIINIAMVVLIGIGLGFGTWSDNLRSEYIDKGISPPPAEFCFHNIIEDSLAGIVSILAGITLIIKPSNLAKMYGRQDEPLQILFIWCFGLLLLILGIYSFWNIYTLNLSDCRDLISYAALLG